MSERPNLLYIHSDQHNPFVLGCHGDALVRTPHLDALAAGGVTCSQVYCPSPVCVASRMSMLSGRYPHEIEVWTNNQILDSAVPTLAHSMGAAGYRPVLMGRMHSIGINQLHGYAERPIGDHGSNWPGSGAVPRDMRSSVTEAGGGQSAYQVHDEDVTAQTVQHLNRLGDRLRAGQTVKPFSLSVGFMLPHHPYLAHSDVYEYYRERITLPTVPEPQREAAEHPFLRWWRERADWHGLADEHILNARAAYWALVEEMDTMIGRILSALEHSGLAPNTLVVYTSDHGDQVGERGLWMKRTFYEESVRVPAILSWPDVLPAGGHCDRIMSALDLNATMLQTLGAPALPHSHGREALDLLRSGKQEWEDVAFSEYALYEGWVQRMIRRDEWKLICHRQQPPQLFNLKADPRELSDRSSDPSCKPVLEDLTEQTLADWDPEHVAARMQARKEETELIRKWAERVRPADQCRWQLRPEMTYREP